MLGVQSTLAVVSIASKQQAIRLTAPESEIALAGALIRKPGLLNEIISTVNIAADDFLHPLCRAVFEIVGGTNAPLDASIIAGKLKAKIGGADFSVFRNTGVLDLSVAIEHAKEIRKMSLLRRFRTEAAELLKNPSRENLNRVNACLTEMTRIENKGPVHIHDAAGHFIASLNSPVNGIPYGFCDLDAWTGGMKPGEYIVVAGRPSMGKSSFAIQVALKAALKGRKVGFFSLEVSEQQIVQKALSMISNIPAQEIRLRRVDEEELKKHLETLAKAPFWIYDESRQTPATIRAAALSIKGSTGLDLVVVDYLQLIGYDGKITSIPDKVTFVSEAIKHLSKELNVPIMVLSQLSREVESRVNKRPTLSDLRGSGAVEQDADTVIFLYREKYYRPGAGDEAEIILAKQREGPVGTAKVIFDPTVTVFKENIPFEE